MFCSAAAPSHTDTAVISGPTTAISTLPPVRIRRIFGGATGYQVLPESGMCHRIGQPCSVSASPLKWATHPIPTAMPHAAALASV